MYDGHSVSCYKRKFDANEKTQLTFSEGSIMPSAQSTANNSCVCKDNVKNLMKQCNGYQTLEDACDATLSTLIRWMAYKNLYRLPCDANTMTPFFHHIFDSRLKML